jgi:hypothetical protein
VGLAPTDLELELKAREASVAGDMVGSVGGGHAELPTALRGVCAGNSNDELRAGR